MITNESIMTLSVFNNNNDLITEVTSLKKKR